MAKKKASSPRSVKWEKPSGVIIETNTNPMNIAKAKELGWKRVR